MDKNYEITTEQQMEAVIGAPIESVRVKIQSQIDDVMKEFIRRSPLVFVSTIDADGNVDMSPKGDPAGFVQVDHEGNLLIPERPGNRLTFGFRNILRNGNIGLMFVVPNQREVLRMKGVATLHRDPEILAQMQVNGAPALLYTRVVVAECYFHCGKALIRSRLWRPESWDTDTSSLFARHIAAKGLIASNTSGELTACEAEDRLDLVYRATLY